MTEEDRENGETDPDEEEGIGEVETEHIIEGEPDPERIGAVQLDEVEKGDTSETKEGED